MISAESGALVMIDIYEVRPRKDKRGADLIKSAANEAMAPVETVEEFKLRIAGIIRAKPEQIPNPARRQPFKRVSNGRAKRRKTR